MFELKIEYACVLCRYSICLWSWFDSFICTSTSIYKNRYVYKYLSIYLISSYSFLSVYLPIYLPIHIYYYIKEWNSGGSFSDIFAARNARKLISILCMLHIISGTIQLLLIDIYDWIVKICFKITIVLLINVYWNHAFHSMLSMHKCKSVVLCYGM